MSTPSKSKSAVQPADLPDTATVDQMLACLQAQAASLPTDPELCQLHVIQDRVFAYANDNESKQFADPKTVVSKSDFLSEFVTEDTGERLHRLGLFRSEPHISSGRRCWYLAMIFKHPANHGDILVFWDPDLAREAREKNGDFKERRLFKQSFSGENFSRVRKHMLNLRGIMGTEGPGKCGEVWAGGSGGNVGKLNASEVMQQIEKICAEDWAELTSEKLVKLGFRRVDNGPQNVLIDF